MRLFCYGTLMVPAVWARVVGRQLDNVAAVLPGFASYRIRGECYPGLVPREAAQTPGVIYAGLNRADLLRLDSYEGAQYRRVRAQARLADGGTQSVWVYVTQARYRSRLSGHGWSLPGFVENDLQKYLTRL